MEHKQYLLFNWDVAGRLKDKMEFPLHNRKFSYLRFNSHFNNSHFQYTPGIAEKV